MKKFILVSLAALSLAGTLFAGDGSCSKDNADKECGSCEGKSK